MKQQHAYNVNVKFAPLVKKEPAKFLCLFPDLSITHLMCWQSIVCLTSVCKEILRKAKVCQKVTSKWLEACDFQYCVLRECQESYILTAR